MQDRIKACEEYVRRAQKRLTQAEVAVTGAVEHRDRMQVEFEEGKRRLADLQVEAQNPPAPVPPVEEMEAEIRRLREQVTELEGTSVVQERPRVRERVSATTGNGFIPLILCQQNSSLVGGSAVDVKDDGRSRTFEGHHHKCSHGALIPRSLWEIAQRIGEASHPGPPR